MVLIEHAMRWSVVAMLLLIPAAQAQDACSQEEPCAWVVDVDESGFDRSVSGDEHTGTVGDWIVLDMSNLDDSMEHTIRFMGQEWTLSSIDFVTSDPIELTEAGSFQIEDSPSGDALDVLITVNDSVDVEGGAAPVTGEGDRGAPGFGLVALLAGLAIAMRRS